MPVAAGAAHFLPHLQRGLLLMVVAVSFAQASMAESSAADTTPPTIWAPQRLPWNPGGYGAGSLWGYKMTPMNESFYIWTFAYDVSGIQTVTL